MSLADAVPEPLLPRAGRDGQTALDRPLSGCRDRLRQMMAVRIDRKLESRTDPFDPVHEALWEAVARPAEYLERPLKPFYIWLRPLAWPRLVELRSETFAEERELSTPRRAIRDYSRRPERGRDVYRRNSATGAAVVERPVVDSVALKRPKFRQGFRLLVPAYIFMNNPGYGMVSAL